MLIQVAVACTVGALAVEVERRRAKRRDSERRGQLLTRAIHRVEGDSAAIRKLRHSEKRLEMDTLLSNLQAASATLTDALAAEARLGQSPIANELDALSTLAEWQEARRTVEQAEEVYSQAAHAYREFVHSLPPPLRTTAADRAAPSLAPEDAWLHEIMGA
jgi:hypothetical protein